jgi:hypothetical protein
MPRRAQHVFDRRHLRRVALQHSAASRHPAAAHRQGEIDRLAIGAVMAPIAVLDQIDDLIPDLEDRSGGTMKQRHYRPRNVFTPAGDGGFGRSGPPEALA